MKNILKVTKRSQVLIVVVFFLGAVGILLATNRTTKLDQKSTESTVKKENNIQSVDITPKILTDEERAAAYNKVIDELEEKTVNNKGDYTDYLTLAQAYFALGDKEKAISNYEKASKFADPKMENYQSFIDTNNQIIQNLKKASQ